jgi:hypothetical protein
MYCGFLVITPYYKLVDGYDGEHAASIFKVIRRD